MIRLTKKDLIWSYIGTILSLCTNVMLLPFIIYYLSGEQYGFWAVLQTIGGITVLFDFGFAVTFARNIAYSWSGASKLEKEGGVQASGQEPDFVFLKKVLHTCRRIYLLISLVALLLLSVVGTWYVASISSHLQGTDHYIAWALYAAAVFLNLYYGYFNAALRGVGDVADANRSVVIAKLAQIVLTIVLLYLNCGLIGIGVAYLAYGLLFRLLAKGYFNKFRGIGEKLRSVAVAIERSEIIEIFKVIWHNAWRDGVVTLANYLSNQACTIICSLYLSLTETGIYSLGVQIATAVVNVSATMYNTYQPVLQSAFITGNKDEERKCMSTITVMYVTLYLLGTVMVVIVGLPLLRLVKPESIVSVPVFLGIAAYQFILKLRNCYTSYFSSTNRLPYVKAFVISSVACVALSMVSMGVLHMGVWGLILSQIVSQLAFNAWYWPMKVHKELELTPVTMVTLCADRVRSIVQKRMKASRRGIDQ